MMLRAATTLARQLDTLVFESPLLVPRAAGGLPCQPLNLSLLTSHTCYAVNSNTITQAAAGHAFRPPFDQGWQLPCAGLHGLGPTRGFAAKGAASAAGAQAPKKRRRSDNKLYSCRNDRVRSMFEQIWPTMQLTEEEAGLFRRNSRIFLTDMGRSIPAKTKFAMAKEDPHQKVPHQDTRSLIYESDLHLDAVGEHPRYLKLRRLRAGNYTSKLQAVRKLRLLLGFCRRHVVQKLYELSRLQPGPDRVWKLICAMEGTLGMSAMRMGLVHDAVAAQGMVNRGVFFVNGVRPLQPRASFIQPGDIIGPGGPAQEWHRTYMASQLGRSLMGEVEQSWSQGANRQQAAGSRGGRG